MLGPRPRPRLQAPRFSRPGVDYRSVLSKVTCCSPVPKGIESGGHEGGARRGDWKGPTETSPTCQHPDPRPRPHVTAAGARAPRPLFQFLQFAHFGEQLPTWGTGQQHDYGAGGPVMSTADVGRR